MHVRVRGCWRRESHTGARQMRGTACHHTPAPSPCGNKGLYLSTDPPRRRPRRGGPSYVGHPAPHPHSSTAPPPARPPLSRSDTAVWKVPIVLLRAQRPTARRPYLRCDHVSPLETCRPSPDQLTPPSSCRRAPPEGESAGRIPVGVCRADSSCCRPRIVGPRALAAGRHRKGRRSDLHAQMFD